MAATRTAASAWATDGPGPRAVGRAGHPLLLASRHLDGVTGAAGSPRLAVPALRPRVWGGRRLEAATAQPFGVGAPRDAPLSPGTHDHGGRSGAADIPREARARGSAPRADRDPDPRGGGAAGGLGAGSVSRSRPRRRLPRSRGASHALLGFSHFRFFLTVPPPCQWRAFS